jgi:cell division septal protein FtsQ
MIESMQRQDQRRRARRNAFLLLLVALAVYAGFIWMSVHRAHG